MNFYEKTWARTEAWPVRDLPSAKLPFRFFVLTCRAGATDFRLPLVDALRRDYETWYIWLKRRPEVTDPDGRRSTLSFLSLLGFLLGFRADTKINVYFNSTNTRFPFITAFMRLILAPGVWCLDMHDDLRYHYTGLRLLRSVVGIRVMRLFSDVTVHAAPTLQELFPSSRHLGNASNILPMGHGANDPRAVLILASLDDRFDFDLMGQVAARCQTLKFHIHGQIFEDDPTVKLRVEALLKKHPNILYHGPYVLNDLAGILGRYEVSFAPYRTGIALTRTIDPLRYYHCLNAGLRLITTAIPQALFMKDSLTIIGNAEECAARLMDGHATTKPYTPITWEQRADKLIGILRGLPKTCRLATALPRY